MFALSIKGVNIILIRWWADFEPINHEIMQIIFSANEILFWFEISASLILKKLILEQEYHINIAKFIYL